MTGAAPALVLASASPRRRHLLSYLRIPFEVLAPEVVEDATHGDGRPERVARRLARAKARAAIPHAPASVILAADTVVAHRGLLLGKPGDPAGAQSMLRRLQGRTHRVVTAVAVLPAAHRRSLVDHTVTRVTMRRYSDEDVAASIGRGDPFDKAGAYAIQDGRLAPVARYDGCYCNVVGLPLWTVVRLLQNACVDITLGQIEGLPAQCQACPHRPDGASAWGVGAA